MPVRDFRAHISKEASLHLKKKTQTILLYVLLPAHLNHLRSAINCFDTWPLLPCLFSPYGQQKNKELDTYWSYSELWTINARKVTCVQIPLRAWFSNTIGCKRVNFCPWCFQNGHSTMALVIHLWVMRTDALARLPASAPRIPGESPLQAARSHRVAWPAFSRYLASILDFFIGYNWGDGHALLASNRTVCPCATHLPSPICLKLQKLRGNNGSLSTILYQQ